MLKSYLQSYLRIPKSGTKTWQGCSTPLQVTEAKSRLTLISGRSGDSSRVDPVLTKTNKGDWQGGCLHASETATSILQCSWKRGLQTLPMDMHSNSLFFYSCAFHHTKSIWLDICDPRHIGSCWRDFLDCDDCTSTCCLCRPTPWGCCVCFWCTDQCIPSHHRLLWLWDWIVREMQSVLWNSQGARTGNSSLPHAFVVRWKS